MVAAREAAKSAGAGLMALRGGSAGGMEGAGGQLKTAVDSAAEGWVLGYLKALYPDDCFLCEERFERSSGEWNAPSAYWTVDALDGTRSFVEGFDGFCVQVAYVADGEVSLGVVHEPVRGVTYSAVAGQGAFVQHGEATLESLRLTNGGYWPPEPVFVDSTPPKGVVARVMKKRAARFMECGSIGVKICRVSDGSADVFAKALTFKLWDTAPGDAILRESGGRLGTWSGETIPYGGRQVYFDNILAAEESLFSLVVNDLKAEMEEEPVDE